MKSKISHFNTAPILVESIQKLDPCREVYRLNLDPCQDLHGLPTIVVVEKGERESL